MMYFSEYAPAIATIENRPEEDVQEAILARWNHARRVAKEDGREGNWNYAVSIFQRYMPRTWHQAMGRTRNPSLPEFEAFILARLKDKPYAPYLQELMQANISNIARLSRIEREGLPKERVVKEYDLSFAEWLDAAGYDPKYADYKDEVAPMLGFAIGERTKRGIGRARRQAERASEHNRVRDDLMERYEREASYQTRSIPLDFSKESDRAYARAAKMRAIRSRQAGR